MNALLSGRSILVVEDEMLVLMDIEDMLADLGCEKVIAAATVEQALRLIEVQSFDAALVDLNLNGVATDAVISALDAKSVPFVLSTGYTDEDIREGLKTRPRLIKPFLKGDVAKILPPVFSSRTPSKVLVG